ncbi:MAG TPA: polyprenyl synthetase family protein, partial [Myxococcota bacterium]
VGVAVDLAAVVELVHGASLLHDDVVDVSDRRRGNPTVNHVEGNAFAVLCGDLVLARALSTLPAMHNGGRLVGDALDVVARMTAAAVIEVDARGRLPERERGLPLWREMAAGKTGALFGLCATVMGHAGDVAEDVVVDACRRLERYGVAFQIVDDLKDLTGADDGKPRGQDVRERALNHPLLYAVADNDSFAADVASAWHKQGSIADDVVIAICERAMQLGGARAIAEARAAVDDSDGAAAAGLVVINAWARGLVEQATALVPAGAGR